MSPELERILQAIWEAENSEASERLRNERRVETLISDALKERPGVSPRDFKKAILMRYQHFQKAQRRHSSLPPKA